MNTVETPSPASTPTRSPVCQSPYARSPFKSPSSSSRENYYDRFVPSRASPCVARKCLFGSPRKDPLACSKQQQSNSSTDPPKVENLTYKIALQNELLGNRITEVMDPQNVEVGKALSVVSPSKSNILKYHSSPSRPDVLAPYSLSPVTKNSQQLLLSPRRVTRKISKTPFKVLDAPELEDDFYLNLLDWSNHNVLAVGLGTAVYLWSACTCQVSKLCDLQEVSDSVTSVSWSEKEQMLSIGTESGTVQIWDAAAEKKIVDLFGHTGRVGSMSWNGDKLCTGSRDRDILCWDYRVPLVPTARLQAHKQEVCGLRWSPNHQLLASGGNDNKLFVWNMSSTSPVLRYNEHMAAVKAIAWSPHQRGILASGGGSSDRTIRFWNTVTGQALQHVDTGSQVCNLAWSKSANELVSTHGYSQNQVIIWRYPSMTQVAKLTGHTKRVLYLAISPDGQTVVTGAGDETLRFWNVFYKSRSHKEPHSPLNLAAYIR